MTSDEARDLFGDAVEGGLDPSKKDAFEAALEADPELREELDAYRLVVQGAASLGARGVGAATGGEGRAAAGAGGDIDDVPVPDLLPGVQSRLRRRSRGRYYRDRFATQAGPRSPVPVLVGIMIALMLAAAWVAVQSLVVIEQGPPPGRDGSAPGDAPPGE